MKKLDHNRVAEGEATGHSHRVYGEGVSLYEHNDENKMIEIPKGGYIDHEEHKTIQLPPGDYNSSIVQEYDHALEEARRVID